MVDDRKRRRRFALAAVSAGFVAWVVIATLGNFVIRASIPGYTEGEGAQDFTVTMMLARLVLGAVASLGAGYVAARVLKDAGRPIHFLAGLLFLLFLPVHIGLWEKFPAWYHLVFLASLLAMTLLGARLYRPGVPRTEPAASRGGPAAEQSDKVRNFDR